MFDGDVEITLADFGWMRTSGLQEISHDVIDARNFLADVFDDVTSRAGCRQVAADDLDHSCNACEWIADFMCEAGRHLTECREVLGARHLGAVKALDFLAALAKLHHHLIKVATEVPDLVVTMGEADGDGKITAAEFSDLLLQFDHRTLHGVGEDDEECAADGDSSGPRDQQNDMALRITPRESGQKEEQHPAQQDACDRHQRFDFPVNSEPW